MYTYEIVVTKNEKFLFRIKDLECFETASAIAADMQSHYGHDNVIVSKWTKPIGVILNNIG